MQNSSALMIFIFMMGMIFRFSPQILWQVKTCGFVKWTLTKNRNIDLTVKNIFENFKEIFLGDTWTITNNLADIILTKNYSPIICKPQTISSELWGKLNKN